MRDGDCAEDGTYARDNFSAAKGISSDMYFGRGNHDPQARGEAQQRLQQFSGASAISSNAYFGRPEEDEAGRAQEMEEGLLGVESLSDLERTAKDAARRLMNQYGIDDFQDLQNGLRQGALKVCTHAGTAGYSVTSRADTCPSITHSLATGSRMLLPATADRSSQDYWQGTGGRVWQ